MNILTVTGLELYYQYKQWMCYLPTRNSIIYCNSQRGLGKKAVRVCLKRDDSRGVEAVHLGYEKKPTVSNRSDRPSVGLYQRTDPLCKARRETAHAGDASGDQWHLVYRREWVSGGCCLGSIRHGKVSTATFSSGAMMGRGNGSTIRCVPRCVGAQVVISTQPQERWIAKASKRRTCLG